MWSQKGLHVSEQMRAADVSLIVLIDAQDWELQAARIVSGYSTVTRQGLFSYFPFSPGQGPVVAPHPAGYI